ncbi:MAG: LysM peptidoglycan-binding domain-containing protein [Pseudohongiellaceae bacterium]
MRKFLLVLTISLAMIQGGFAADSILRPGHPERYVVKEGDTLWDIAAMFLTDAWLWPEIWHINPDIENPHLIYPGDAILLTFVDGEPQLTVQRGENRAAQKVWRGDRDVTVRPAVRATSLSSAIPAIPLDAISTLLTTGRIVDQDTLNAAPYVLAGTADRLIFGAGDDFYARGNWQSDTTAYGIFRQGEVYRDPVTREILGYEAIEVGTAAVEAREDDVYTMNLTSVKQEVRLGDRLLPTEARRVESTFYPSSPTEDVDGLIMTVLGGVSQVGRYDVVALNRGLNHGLDVGHVLAIYKSGKLVRDQVSRERVRLPSQRAGLVMVFRPFTRMSYGIVLQTDTPLRVGDIVQNP